MLSKAMYRGPIAICADSQARHLDAPVNLVLADLLLLIIREEQAVVIVRTVLSARRQ